MAIVRENCLVAVYIAVGGPRTVKSAVLSLHELVNCCYFFNLHLPTSSSSSPGFAAEYTTHNGHQNDYCH